MIDLSAALVSGSMAAAAGLIGAFALMRRMTLAGDALSHVALPGIGLAILLRLDPLAGALIALIAGALLVWRIEERTRLSTETIIGVVFSAALAIGVLVTPGEELIDALFGAPGSLSTRDIATGLAGAGAVIVFAVLARDRLVILFLSSDVARTTGIRVRLLTLLYLIAFAVAVALGLRYLGALLMGSLIIIPAATARLWARNLRAMLWWSASLAVAATLAGSSIATQTHHSSGPLIVLAASACFVVSLAAKRSIR